MGHCMGTGTIYHPFHQHHATKSQSNHTGSEPTRPPPNPNTPHLSKTEMSSRIRICCSFCPIRPSSERMGYGAEGERESLCISEGQWAKRPCRRGRLRSCRCSRWDIRQSGSAPMGQSVNVMALALIVFIGQCLCCIVFYGALVVSPQVTLRVY